MNRAKSIIIILLFIFLMPLTVSGEKALELVIKKGEKTGDDEIRIEYAVINHKNFALNNVSIVFKILDGDVPVGCREIITTVPKGSDGSVTESTTFKIPGGVKDLRYQSNIFYSTKRYHIEQWFSGCKEF